MESIKSNNRDSHELWCEYEHRKKRLPPMPPAEYEKACEKIRREVMERY